MLKHMLLERAGDGTARQTVSEWAKPGRQDPARVRIAGHRCDHTQRRRSADPRTGAETFDRSAIGGACQAGGSSREPAVAENRGSTDRAVRPVMPGYLLDTNILSDLVHHPRSGTAARQLALVRAHGGENISTSIIAAADLRHGVAKRGSP